MILEETTALYIIFHREADCLPEVQLQMQLEMVGLAMVLEDMFFTIYLVAIHFIRVELLVLLLET